MALASESMQPPELESQNSTTVQQQQSLAGDKKASRIHLSGASGSGVSTLGTNLSSALSFPVFDVDSYYWLPTNPPYTAKRPVDERIALIRAELKQAEEQYGGWVLSGSMESWGQEILNKIDHVIFIETTTEVRMKRLRAREYSRHGERILEGGDMHTDSVAFLAWAEAYDIPDVDVSTVSRTRVKHENWLRGLKVPVTRLSGEEDEIVMTSKALKSLRRSENED